MPVFFGFNTARGNMKAFCVGGVLQSEDTRVETANVNGFSSTTQVDGRVGLKMQNHSLAHDGRGTHYKLG